MFHLRNLLITLTVVALSLESGWCQPPGKNPPGGGQSKTRQGQGQGQPSFELGRVLPPQARRELKLSSEQEQAITQLEREVKARLEKILSAEQKKQLENMRPPGGGQGPGGQGGPGGGVGFGPGGGPPGKEGPGNFDGQRPPPGKDGGNEALLDSNSAHSGIQWFTSWESGLAEAKKTGRPILMVSAAPHCAGVPGIW